MTESAEVAALESAAVPEVQAKAEKLGWIPPARFKGDPTRFIDAEAYLERGATVLPIVKEHNKRLEKEIAGLREHNVKTEAALKAAQDAIDQIEERNSVATQKAVTEAKAQVKRQLAAASEAGDHEAVAELTEQMVDLNATPAPEKKPAAPAAPAAWIPPKDLAEWNTENPWFGTNKRKTALAIAIAQELREAGETVQGRQFFDRVAEEMDKELGVARAEPRNDKVEGARNVEDESSRRGKSWNSLPADARAACDSDARQFVGKGKKYADLAAWRSRYAEIYFEGS